jgi:hypothetical protein
MTRSARSRYRSACWAPEEIVLIHHTDCEMLTGDDEFRRQIQDEMGIKHSGRRRPSATSTRT